MEKFDLPHAYSQFARKVKANNRHIRDADDMKFLATLLAQARSGRETAVPVGTVSGVRNSDLNGIRFRTVRKTPAI